MGTKNTSSKVVELPGRKDLLESEKRWGKLTMKCKFNIVPALLLRAQGRLGIKPVHLAIIIQITDFWWKHDQMPWVSKGELAARLNIKEKTVQRALVDLEKAGLVKRVVRIRDHRRRANGYDLSGLVEKLQALAPEFIAAAEARKKVEKRGSGLDLLAQKL